MSAGTELKALETRIKTHQADLKMLKDQQAEISKQITAKQQQISAVQGQIDKLKRSDLVLSEHALLRYIERAQLVDVKAIEGQLITPALRLQVQTLGDGEYPVGDLKAVVKQNMIVTIK